MGSLIMCADQHCNNYGTCYRAQATPEPEQRFYALSPREGTECHFYAPTIYSDGASALKEQHGQ